MDGYKHGQWNAICQRCGFKHKSSEIRLEWTGLRVCGKCHETRHPQDMLEAKEDRQAPPWVSPEATDNFVATNEITRDDL